MSNAWYAIFYYAAVVAILVRALVKEEIFREPRAWLERYLEDRHHPWLLRKAAYMPTCEFCCSFWVSLILILAVFHYRLLFDDGRGYFVSIFVTMAVANVYMAAFSLIRVDLRRERAVAEHIERRKSA
ncbi:MAG TPA: hypothetical protein VFA18_01370 [Gemmataceae bacterium]|nr:hypothetical protein [Gemmataceae bacterium]